MRACPYAMIPRRKMVLNMCLPNCDVQSRKRGQILFDNFTSYSSRISRDYIRYLARCHTALNCSTNVMPRAGRPFGQWEVENLVVRLKEVTLVCSQHSQHRSLFNSINSFSPKIQLSILLNLLFQSLIPPHFISSNFGQALIYSASDSSLGLL